MWDEEGRVNGEGERDVGMKWGGGTGMGGGQHAAHIPSLPPHIWHTLLFISHTPSHPPTPAAPPSPSSVSPLAADEYSPALSVVITTPPRRDMALSNDSRVRVEGS